ncbi:hypothetical protein EBI01_05585 [Marinomonas rhizomae]|uniref:Lipoprotein n=2 Tax=Marinomonas rhizomae TaxID=491948 RepID=A0A366JCZ1_9GAMM|nr:hypothetical protein DFP80_104152 [Marinomonas rhizomae]RNF74571.1 hypothetical protein EBI01_05585 [Marinomonas rhizomae]
MIKKLSIAATMLLTGCATSNMNYTKPSSQTIINQIVINEKFDTIWDRLVKNLASDFFIINNIEKSSRIINVSFSTGKPSDYVDCGNTVREFNNARGKSLYTYDPSDSASYTFTNLQGHAFNAIRTSRLNGRTNVYLAPEGEGTVISVNTKYVVDVDVKYYNIVNNQFAGNENFTFDFSTKSEFSNPGGVTCVARGNLEQKILSYAE